MLHELHISDLGVIRDLDLELDPGLTVLTGETGAGKTMVTVGLGLALGARGNAQLVRTDAVAARVQARFDAPADAGDDVAAWIEDGQVILARTVAADGKTGARIGGQLSTAGALTALGGRLVEIHGQHQSLRLLESATQTAFLDRFAGPGQLEAVMACGDEHRGYRDAAVALDTLREAARDREREIDVLRYQVDEITAVAPTPGETEALLGEEARLGHVERLLEISAAVEASLTDEGGAADAVAAAASGLEAASGLDPASGGLADRARGLAAEVAELGHDARGYRESLSADPERLAFVRARVGALRPLQRKYGKDDQRVLAFLASATERLEALESAEELLEELEAEVGSRRDRLTTAAAQVNAGRAAAAPRLAEALTGELRALGMPDATCEVVLEALPDMGAAGRERAELRVAGGSGQPALPLAKGASGGELSRLMLACRSVLADLDEVGTLVFDEVDAGIGGQAGLAVGRRLAALAVTHQVIVVTHLPQIACFADRHVRVRKDAGLALVDVLEGEERVRELSRMLAGLEASEHGVSHAEELLTEAARIRADRHGASVSSAKVGFRG